MSEAYDELDRLYAELPTIDCKKLCGREICGPIAMSRLEALRIIERRGALEIAAHPLPGLVGLQTDFNRQCKLLERTFGRCLMYRLRPMICRLWGCVDDPRMRCPHGCQPSRWLTNAEAHEFEARVLQIQNEWEKHA